MTPVHYHLKTLPDYLQVKDNKPEDPRVTYVLDEYRHLRATGVPLPELTDETTLGEVKDALAEAMNTHTGEVSKFTTGFTDKYLKTDYVHDADPRVRQFEWIKLAGFVISGVLVLIVVISLIIGIITGDNNFLANILVPVITLIGSTVTGSPPSQPPF